MGRKDISLETTSISKMPFNKRIGTLLWYSIINLAKMEMTKLSYMEQGA
jgi:hypothetical protein